MNTSSETRNALRNILAILGATLLAALLLFVLYSLLNPYDRLGYKTLLVDSSSKIYKSGDTFDYGPYTFSVLIKHTPVPLRLLTCDHDESYLSLKDCLNLNEQTTEKRSMLGFIEVSYEIISKAKNPKALEGDWLQVYNYQGERILNAPSGTQTIPNVPISKTLSSDETDKVNATPVSVVISLPDRAKQTVVLPK